ncbi:MAG TPA: hypothetical protein ACFYEK_06160 [Candidatus Wunengus sp. YC60]|uniref:hypothetical protein n=1 Tax=Candidatus Wunengus sp. YC60 TaxID=3367697 RepID=UPI00402833D9
MNYSTTLKAFVLNKLVDRIAGTVGTAGTASLYFYNYAQPSSADTDTTSGSIGYINNIGWGTSGITAYATTSGTVGLAATSYLGTSCSSGTAVWGRFETIGVDYRGSAATFRIDGDVGTAATNTIILSTVIFAAGKRISLGTAKFSIT